MRVGVVTGDDLMPSMDRFIADGHNFSNLETFELIDFVRDRLVTANAYIGAEPIVEAISQGANLIITGRVADPSMTVAPAAARFGWSADDHQRLAGATVAGHLIECGTQVTGGIFTHWDEIPDPANIGYPIVEVDDDGNCVVTKPDGTGGCVTSETVKEQLVYELGDPAAYLSPDVTVDFTTLTAEEVGHDRVAVRGATGRPPPDTYKVSATYHDGYRATGTLTLVAPRASELGIRCGEIVQERVRRAGYHLEEFSVECIETFTLMSPPVKSEDDAGEVTLRMTAKDPRRAAIERFTKEIVPLVTTGPQGITGYAAGRPKVQEVFAYWPTLIERRLIQPDVRVVEVGS
jgi:hypothetical protein